jgi:hypothetical protein
MKLRTRHANTPAVILVVLAGALISASCAAGPGTPTAPSTGVANLAFTAQSPGGNQQSMSTASRHRPLLLTKTCDAIDHCTVITSPSGPIPVGSDVNYFGPLLEARTTSKIVVTTPGGDTATGHCSVSYRTGEGTCVLTDGTGALAGLLANLKVSSDFASDPAGVFTWEGEYHSQR